MQSNTLRVLLILLSLALNSGCLSDVKSETVFPEEAPGCESQKIPGEYVVEWSSGEISIERGGDRDSFKENFVRPNVDQIKWVEQNKRLFVEPIAADSQPSNTFSEDEFSNWGAVASGADQAWAQGIIGSGIVVAIIDTGVDYTHPQLSQQIALNTEEISNNNRDDDGNGYVDDYYGYNFALDQGDPFDVDRHGTHVAGTVAAEHHDLNAGPQDYVQGIAPGAKILPISFLDNTGGGTLEAAVRAIDYAVARKVDIINASWGGAGCSPLLAARIELLYSKNILFVAAAGNRGVNIDRLNEYPASYNFPAQVTVGAITPSGVMADFSNYGLINVHIFAPGKDIASTTPFSNYETFSGTSMAAPHVSGALALLKSKAPFASLTDLKKALLNGATIHQSYLNSTQGRLNIPAALSRL